MKFTVWIDVAEKNLKSFSTCEDADDFKWAIKWLYHQLGQKNLLLIKSVYFAKPCNYPYD